MVKRKKNICDVKLTKGHQKKKNNPFEVHINRQKFNIIGRKPKFDRGLPGVARTKALKKRKETLLQEYKVKDKTNSFLDRRIGEKNKSMTSEDKIMARFAAEKMKAHKRKTMFNLAEEEEILTHKGRSISEVERFDDPRSDDEEDNNVGGLDANFVDGAHFGGGMFTKSNNSRESVIDQLIADSKKRKIERQQVKEKTLELTEKLDAEWKELIPIMGSSTKKEESETKERDSYDIAVRELMFEARGKPSDKLKSEEEIVAKEAKKLQDLEEERLRRMRGEDTSEVVVKKSHRSADDLDDGFQIDNDEEFSLTYDKDGNVIMPEGRKRNEEENSRNIDKKAMERDEGEEEELEVDSEKEEDENLHSSTEEESSDEDDLSDLKVKPVHESDSEEDASGDEKREVENNQNVQNENSDEAAREKTTCTAKQSESNETRKHSKKTKLLEDSVTDCKSNEQYDTVKVEKNIEILELSKFQEHLVDETEPNKTNTDLNECDSFKLEQKNEPSLKVKSSKKVSFQTQIEEVRFGENAFNIGKKSPKEFLEQLMKKKDLMEKARKELPYTFSVPETYEELETVFKGRNMNEIAVIVERMIICNHPKLKEENKNKMSTLFAFLMQHLHDLDYKDCWVGLDSLAPLLYDITQFSSINSATCIVDILKEKHTEYCGKKYKYPSTDTLVFLRLIPVLFPSSDRRHPVTTPALVFISEMLQNCKVTTRRAIATGLFLVSLIIEYTSLSKRICPSAVNFLLGLFHLASSPTEKCSTLPPFNRNHRFLYLKEPFSLNTAELKMTVSDLSPKSQKIDDSFRVRSIFTSLGLVNMMSDLLKDHSGVQLVLQPFLSYLDQFELSKYQSEIAELVGVVKGKLKGIQSEELEPLSLALRKPKALRLYEPSIEPVYETKKRKYSDPEKSEKERMLHKYKRELKGAVREIRRDTAFLAKIKFKEQAASDAERIKKVNEIYRSGAEQQGEHNKLMRKKKKKH